MTRIILPSLNPGERELEVRGRSLRYLRDVLRVSRDDAVTVLDGKGVVLETRVKKTGREAILLEVIGEGAVDGESPLHLVLIQGLLKGDRMDLAVQKATELGVKEIFPVVTSRSQLRFSRKAPHWRRVAEEASRQSGRRLVPLVHDVREVGDVLASLAEGSLRIIFCESEQEGLGLSPSLSASVVYYMVGPEGGFSAGEVRAAEGAGFVRAGLGRRILRAETAAIAGAVLLQFLLGDLSPRYRPGQRQ